MLLRRSVLRAIKCAGPRGANLREIEATVTDGDDIDIYFTIRDLLKEGAIDSQDDGGFTYNP